MMEVHTFQSRHASVLFNTDTSSDLNLMNPVSAARSEDPGGPGFRGQSPGERGHPGDQGATDGEQFAVASRPCPEQHHL